MEDLRTTSSKHIYGIEGAEPVVQVPHLRSLALDLDGDERPPSVETTEKAEATQMNTLVAPRKMTDEKIRIAQLMRSRGEPYEKIGEAGREASRLRALANAADKEQQDRIHEAHEAEEAVKKAVLKQVRPRDFARLYPKENNDSGTGKEGEK